MKFSTVPGLLALVLPTALSTVALAAGVTDSPTSSLLTLLARKVTTLDATISSYTGNTDADISPIQSASNGLIITIDRGLRDILSGPDLTAAETRALTPQFETLTIALKTTISNLVDKKPLFDRTETTICESHSVSIRKALYNQHSVWGKLFALISSKASEADSTLVSDFAERMLITLQEALDPFVDSTSSCSADAAAPLPPPRVELRSYTSGNSSAPGNGTSTLVPAPTSSQTTAPEPPAFTGAAPDNTIDERGMKMLGMGVLAAAVVGAL